MAETRPAQGPSWRAWRRRGGAVGGGGGPEAGELDGLDVAVPEHEASGGERRERDRAGGVGEEVLLPQPRARDEGAVGGEAVGERRRARGARREDAADGGVVRHRGERARGGVHVAERVADGVDASARVAVRRACRRVVGGDELLEGNAVGAKREDEIVAAEHLDRGGRVREDVQGAAGDGALALGGARAREEGLRGEAEGLETNGEGDEGQRQRAARGSGSAARDGVEASKRRTNAASFAAGNARARDARGDARRPNRTRRARHVSSRRARSFRRARATRAALGRGSGRARCAPGLLVVRVETLGRRDDGEAHGGGDASERGARAARGARLGGLGDAHDIGGRRVAASVGAKRREARAARRDATCAFFRRGEARATCRRFRTRSRRSFHASARLRFVRLERATPQSPPGTPNQPVGNRRRGRTRSENREPAGKPTACER